jgi:hypothetical protein
MRHEDVNLAWWEERAGLDGQDGFHYDIQTFLAGGPAVSDRELEQLEAAVRDLLGIDQLHLQCHIGLGTCHSPGWAPA